MEPTKVDKISREAIIELNTFYSGYSLVIRLSACL